MNVKRSNNACPRVPIADAGSPSQTSASVPLVGIAMAAGTVTPGGLVQVHGRPDLVPPRQSRREPRRDRLAGRRGAALVVGVCHAGIRYRRGGHDFDGVLVECIRSGCTWSPRTPVRGSSAQSVAEPLTEHGRPWPAGACSRASDDSSALRRHISKHFFWLASPRRAEHDHLDKLSDTPGRAGFQQILASVIRPSRQRACRPHRTLHDMNGAASVPGIS